MKCPVVEVTGSFGKTSTIWAAISVLKNRYSILAMTSDGIFHINESATTQLAERVSTTPANIIKAVRLCREKIDLAMFEVSLGGTGLADLGIIKNVYDNYPIAEGTSRACDAKLSMIKEARPNSSVLVNADDPLLRGLSDAQMFSSFGREVEVRADNVMVNDGGIRFEAFFSNFRDSRGSLVSGKHRIQASPRLVGRQHVENLLVASAIAVFFGADENDVAQLRSFNGVGDKMVLDNPHNPTKVLNISSSIGPLSLERAIKDFLEVFGPPVSLCIGGKIKTTCGSANLKEFADVITGFHELNPVALFGELGESIRPLLREKEIVDTTSLGSNPVLYIERR